MKIVCTADNHLRASQFGRRSRGQDFMDAFERMIHQANKELAGEKSKVILNAGDILDTVRPTPEVMFFLRKCQSLMEELEITMYYISGNHDLATEKHWLESVSNPSSCFGFVCIDWKVCKLFGTELTIVGIPFCGGESMLKRLKEFCDESPKITLAVIHEATNEICSFPMERGYDATALPFKDTNLRTVVVGDIHIQQVLKPCEKVPDATVISPGTLETCSVSEDPEHSITVIDIEPKTGVVNTFKTVNINARGLYKFKLTEESHVTEALKQLDKVKAEAPIVQVIFDPELNDVIPRINTVVTGTDVIMRYTVIIKDMVDLAKAVANDAENEEGLTVIDFLDRLVDKEDNGMLYQTLLHVLNGGDLESEINAFIQLKEDSISTKVDDSITTS